jgi:hypothetical protein
MARGAGIVPATVPPEPTCDSLTAPQRQFFRLAKRDRFLHTRAGPGTE